MLTIDIKARTFPGIPFQHIGDLVPRRTPEVPRRAQKYLYKCFHPIWVQDSKSIWGKNGEELKKTMSQTELSTREATLVKKLLFLMGELFNIAS